MEESKRVFIGKRRKVSTGVGYKPSEYRIKYVKPRGARGFSYKGDPPAAVFYKH